MMTKKAVFIAATGQNVGKTTLCLGMIAALRKRFPSVGFIKPVGQRHVKVDEHTNVDKDTVLFKQHFQLSASWKDMSPIIVPPGFTRNYLDDQVSEKGMLEQIHKAFNDISSQNAYTIVEGTGHVGVGSIFNLNNARVASELKLGIVIIASAGLGSAYDELALNVAMCRHYGLKIHGVILNRVMEDKRAMILDYFPKALKRWEIPLIGCVPFSEALSYPTMQDFENLFDTQLLSGHKYHNRSFRHSRLVAGSLEAYKSEMTPNELIITPASREDIVQCVLENQLKYGSSGGIILTSNIPPTAQMLQRIREVDIPVIYAPMCSYDAMKMLTSFTTKIRTEDLPKIQHAIQLVEKYVNIDAIIG
jgi:phosphate acetyltransferase